MITGGGRKRMSREARDPQRAKRSETINEGRGCEPREQIVARSGSDEPTSTSVE
jgi:hypothetical protein